MGLKFFVPFTNGNSICQNSGKESIITTNIVLDSSSFCYSLAQYQQNLFAVHFTSVDFFFRYDLNQSFLNVKTLQVSWQTGGYFVSNIVAFARHTKCHFHLCAYNQDKLAQK